MSTIVYPLSGQDIYSSSSIQLFNLGQIGETADGRSFRYCKAGATALVPGKTQQNAVVSANYNALSVADASAAATSVTVTLSGSAVTANQFKEGFLIIDGGTGAGYMYKIKGHPAQTSTTGTVAIALENPIVTALSTATVCLVRNPYDAVIIAPATPTGCVVGVAQYPIAASEYGWLQIEGTAAVLGDATFWAVGDMVGMSALTDGAAITAVLAQGYIGNAMGTGASTYYRPVLLKI